MRFASIVTIVIVFFFFSGVQAIAQERWTGEIKEDSITAKKFGIAIAVGVGDSRLRPIAVVNCEADESLEIFFIVKEYIGDSSREFIARFNEDEPNSFSGLPLPDGTGVSLREVDKGFFIDAMRSGNQLNMRVFDYRSIVHDMKFSLAGFTNSFKTACDWHSEYESLIIAQKKAVAEAQAIEDDPSNVSRWKKTVRAALKKELSILAIAGCQVDLEFNVDGGLGLVSTSGCRRDAVAETLIYSMSDLPLPKEFDVLETSLTLKF